MHPSSSPDRWPQTDRPSWYENTDGQMQHPRSGSVTCEAVQFRDSRAKLNQENAFRESSPALGNHFPASLRPARLREHRALEPRQIKQVVPYATPSRGVDAVGFWGEIHYTVPRGTAPRRWQRSSDKRPETDQTLDPGQIRPDQRLVHGSDRVRRKRPLEASGILVVQFAHGQQLTVHAVSEVPPNAARKEHPPPPPNPPPPPAPRAPSTRLRQPGHTPRRRRRLRGLRRRLRGLRLHLLIYPSSDGLPPAVIETWAGWMEPGEDKDEFKVDQEEVLQWTGWMEPEEEEQEEREDEDSKAEVETLWLKCVAVGEGGFRGHRGECIVLATRHKHHHQASTLPRIQHTTPQNTKQDRTQHTTTCIAHHQGAVLHQASQPWFAPRKVGTRSPAPGGPPSTSP